MRSLPKKCSAMSRCDAPAASASWTRNISISRSSRGSRGNNPGRKRPVRHKAASRRKGIRRASVATPTKPVTAYWRSTGLPDTRLPSVTSIRTCRKPSERTACSCPDGSTASVNIILNRRGSKSFAVASPVGIARTCTVPGSSVASQMTRASVASRRGSSAKVEPPNERIALAALVLGHAARGGIPGDIPRVAAQPLPHDASAIDPPQAGIGRRIPPVRWSF